MNKDLGRLELRDIRNQDEQLEKIFKFINDQKFEQARANLVKMLSTPNYFIREYIGKKLVEYKDGDMMDQVILMLLGHKVYGVRAATIFYYHKKYQKEPKRMLSLLEMSWGDTPWETEQVLYELWQKHPAIMKKEMIKWAESPFEKQRTLAYHGIETIASGDSIFITSIVEKNLDNESLEIQKKITNVLTHAVRINPAECYSFIREWLTDLSESRKRTLYIVMKKLVSIAMNSHSNNKTPRNDEFYLLTMQVIKDWKSDPDKSISSLGEKLVSLTKNPYFNDND